MNTQLERLNGAQVGSVLGYVVYWGLEECRVGVQELHDLFTKFDLPEKTFFPPDIQGGNAARKALKQIMGQTQARGYMHRKITEQPSFICWGIVKEERDQQNIDLDYTCPVKITFDKTTESLVASGDVNSEAYQLANQIVAAYTQLKETYVAWDIQRMLLRAARDHMNGIGLRKGGGNYFILPEHAETLDKIQNVVESIGSCEVGILVLRGDDQHNVRSIGRDASKSLGEELASLQAEIEKFKSTPPRPSTIKKRFELYQELRKRVDLYTTMLDITIADFDEGMAACEAELTKMLSGSVAAPAEANPQPEEETPEPQPEPTPEAPAEKPEAAEAAPQEEASSKPPTATFNRRRKRRRKPSGSVATF